MSIGRWSEDISCRVFHSQREAMSNVASEISGDVAELLMLCGLRVGVFISFRMLKCDSWSM